MNKLKMISLLLVGVLSLTACSSSSGDALEGEVAEISKTPVETMTVVASDMTNTVLLSGTIASAREVPVSAMLQGEVLSVNVREGDAVSKGQVLYTVDGGEMQSQYEDAKENLETTKIINEKTLKMEQDKIASLRELYNLGGISSNDLEAAEIGFLSTELQLKSTIENAETQLRQLEDQLSNTSVTAPIDGVVTTMDVVEGTIAQATQLIVSETNMPQVDIGISETLLPFIKTGDNVVITVPAVSSESFEASVRSVSTTTNPQTGLYSVKIDLPLDADYSIGMFVNAEFETEKQTAVINIPQAAILTDLESKFVYVVEGDKARKVFVTTGLTNGTNTEITSGLTGNEVLVVKGAEYLTDDTYVEIVGGN